MTFEFALSQGLLQRIQSEYEEQPGLPYAPASAAPLGSGRTDLRRSAHGVSRCRRPSADARRALRAPAFESVRYRPTTGRVSA